MYFDFEDRRPDTPILDRPLTRLEQVLMTIIAYLLIVIALIVYPRLPFVKAAEAARLKELEQKREQLEAMREPMQFVFAKPRVEVQKAPDRPKYLSDESHRAQAREKAPVPKNDNPFSRGNTFERTSPTLRRRRTNRRSSKPRRPRPTPTRSRCRRRRSRRLRGTTRRTIRPCRTARPGC